MQITKKNIGIIALALLIGLGLGYLIFGHSGKAEAAENHHQHSMEGEAMPMSKDAEIWTCSMHPQIKQPEPGDCPLCGMDLIPLEENTSDGV